jgi:3-phosphoshikimate 1-carboxyvinyltransferase
VPAYQIEIRPVRRLSGTLSVPGDKSLSHRYAMLAALAQGVTSVAHFAPGADVRATVECLRALGAVLERTGPDELTIHGCGAHGFRQPDRPLDAANSGTTMRLLAGLLAGCPIHTTLVGDPSLSRRPMRRVIDPLSLMGARISSADGHAPLVIEGGRLHGIDYDSPVPSAQVKSAVLLAGVQASGTTTVREPVTTRDHTERAFPVFGLDIETGEGAATVRGGQHAAAPAGPLRVPGDPSSAAVWAACAAAIPGSSVRLDGVCLNPHRLGFARALERMGADVRVEVEDMAAGELVGRLTVTYGEPRSAAISGAEVPSLIDELPVLSAAAALGAGLEVSGAGELRYKESDRITALVAGLRALGVDATERPDGFVIAGAVGGRRPKGGRADAVGDHRLVMAFALVAIGASGPSVICGADAVGISYPGFEHDLARLTA